MYSVEDYDLAKLWVESQSETNIHLPNQEGEQVSTSDTSSKRVSMDSEGDQYQDLLM